MNIISAKFIKGVVEEDELLDDGTPQVAFVGRSNVGKSSVINSVCNQKNLARTSSFPGATQEINIFSISSSGKNPKIYLVDMPGYGFAKASKEVQVKLQQLIHWYLFSSNYEPKLVVLIIDATIGATDTDIQMLYSLKESNKNVLVVANKVDKLKPSEYKKQLNIIQDQAGEYKVLPYSAEKKIGVNELIRQILI